MLEERHVVLGCDGDVVLIGRGRRGSSREDDLAAVERLAPRAGLEAGSRAELARWVCTRWVPESVLFELEIQAEQTVHLDEVVPDIGPDPDAARGLLDGWATTTSSGSRGEVTAEVTDTGSNTRRLAMLLWARMVSGGDGPQPERFVQVDGQPSRGIRALVTELGLDPVPVALGIGPGVLVSGISSAGADTEDPTLTLPYEELASFEDPEDTAIGAVTADPRENTITETATRSSVGLTAAIALLVILALLWLLWVG